MPRTVFIVEDTRSHAILFDNLLRARGHNVVHGEGGWETIAAIRDTRPHLVLMDIKLPMVSGLDLVKALKDDGELKGIPVIAVTAHAMEADRVRCLAAGFDDYVAKPIDALNFLNRVDLILSGIDSLG
ncbi:MAG: response regulator [Magnetospirillum sp. WYHS-4]